MHYRYREPKKLPVAEQSSVYYLKLAPRDMAMFRFLLEAFDNAAMFTVLEPKQTLLKLIFSPHQQAWIDEILLSMQKKVAFTLIK